MRIFARRVWPGAILAFSGVTVLGYCFFEFFEQGDLRGVDHSAGAFEGEPCAAVDFGEGELFAGAAGPFQFKCITDDGGGIEIAGGGPGVDAFATFLANGT